MDSANWMTAIGRGAHLFVQSLPDAFLLAYDWAKDWQLVLGGLAVLIAAQIFANGSIRSARIRAAASVRAAQIAAGMMPNDVELVERAPARNGSSIRPPAGRPPQPVPEEQGLSHKLDQLRSYIRSAMALQASDVDGSDGTGNIYCERIARLRFDERDLTARATPSVLDLYKKFLLQLAAVRRANEKGQSPQDLSEALFQLNARARELAAALGSSATAREPTRQPGQARV